MKDSQHTAIDHMTITRQQVARHDMERPFAPENGQPLRFGIGDAVAIRELMEADGEGITVYQVTGYYVRKESALYANGKRYLLNVDAHWFPYSEAELIGVKSKTPHLF